MFIFKEVVLTLAWRFRVDVQSPWGRRGEEEEGRDLGLFQIAGNKQSRYTGRCQRR